MTLRIFNDFLTNDVEHHIEIERNYARCFENMTYD